MDILHIKIVMFVWKRPKINKKEPGDGPFRMKTSHVASLKQFMFSTLHAKNVLWGGLSCHLGTLEWEETGGGLAPPINLSHENSFWKKIILKLVAKIFVPQVFWRGEYCKTFWWMIGGLKLILYIGQISFYTMVSVAKRLVTV